ncbi:SRPBCC family protein [Micromonospora sp. PTRAS2]
MSSTKQSAAIRQQAVAEAPAATVFDLVADATRWPQLFTAGVHAKVLQTHADGDLVRRWALDGTTVRTWTSRRTLDRDGLSIRAHNIEGEPGDRDEVRWSFEQLSPTSTRVRVEHNTTGDPAVVAERSQRQLDELVAVAGRAAELEQLVISFADPLFIAGRKEDAYEFLYAADQWPSRVPHVSKLTMTEEVKNIQFFDMDTVTPDGRGHTTRSVRVCQPDLIVYKQIELPVLLDAHTGHWRFTETPEGVTVEARHTATIKPSALSALGEGTTVQDARKYLRRVLSTNSLQTLRYAQTFVEERAAH